MKGVGLRVTRFITKIVFQSIVISTPINPDFFFTGFPRFPTGKISRRASLPSSSSPFIFEMMENGGKSGIDTSMRQEIGNECFRMIVGTVRLARAFQFEEERKIRFRGYETRHNPLPSSLSLVFQACPHR